MIEKDSIRLLRECDAGVKMGIASIEDVEPYASAAGLKAALTNCKEEHQRLGREIENELKRFHDDGKDPNPIAKGMSHLKTEVKLVMNESDGTIADLMTDGCNMGVKSLHRYLNQYKQADAESRGIATRLIQLEDDLAKQMRQYL